jgi:hypothetical protein
MSQETIYQILKTATGCEWDSDEDVWDTTYAILEAISE